jgi:hypothetical protein
MLPFSIDTTAAIFWPRTKEILFTIDSCMSLQRISLHYSNSHRILVSSTICKNLNCQDACASMDVLTFPNAFFLFKYCEFIFIGPHSN